jgi:hypothetical protein
LNFLPNNKKERIEIIVKKLKKIILGTIMTMIIMVLCAGCTGAEDDKNPIKTTNNATDAKANHSSDKIGFIMEGIDVPEVVLDTAKAQVQRLFEINRTDYPDYNYVNWRIEKLTYSYTYDDLYGMRLAVFQMNYEFLSESPDNIVLAGGMYITEDNWVMPGYPNSIYLIFQQDDEKLTFLQSIVENDCTPGTQIFTEDLLQILT